MRRVRLGAPTDPDTDQGPMVSFTQRDRVAAMVERALRDGAKAVAGGQAPGGELAEGAYYEPTLLINADQRSEIVQAETFGPVLVALAFDSDEEAIRLANDTPFGLAASAWTRDVFRAQTASRLIEAGTVWVNDHIPIISEMPHGGRKASGYGKDMSSYSFDEYTQIKHVMSDITGVAAKPWHTTIFNNA
jgi:betaine-aldehyde dehydrogenase